MTLTARSLAVILLLPLLTACSSALARKTCSLTEPVWAKLPADSAVQNEPVHGYYYVNEDQSIWTSAWWAEGEEHALRMSEDDVKVGWFRPAGAPLEISGRCLDGDTPALGAEASCCYPTRFQASGLYFPTEGCWEVNARANGKELTFVVRVEPRE